MPELPEVQTTASGLNAHIVGLSILDVWTNYKSAFFARSHTIKNPAYFADFRRAVMGRKVMSVTRRAKNVLIHLDDGATILVHMKMTGHLLYGRYRFDAHNKSDPWLPLEPESLKDPYNRHVHFVIRLNNGRHVALSDVRTFAKVSLIQPGTHEHSEHLVGLGPEPLESRFDFAAFNERINMRPRGKIKQVLLDQTIIAGIGNIYTDESLWRAAIHPLTPVAALSSSQRRALFTAIKKTLSRGIDFGGDSTSDYRNIHGEKGSFHESHQAYRRTGERCGKKGCRGIIKRIVVGGRGTHFCPVHQKLPQKSAK